MNKEITFFIEPVSSDKKNFLESELEVLKGVKNINIDEKSGRIDAVFDDSLISQELIFRKVEESGYNIKKEPHEKKEHVYFVKGTHCASCEILIEKRLLEFKNIKSVEAKSSKGEVLIEYENNKPDANELSEIFKKENYQFSDKPFEKDVPNRGFFNSLLIAGFIIIGFLYLNKIGLAGFVNVNSKSSLPAFFVLGLLAGVSSCAALVGGLVLSMSKQWAEISLENDSIFKKLQPHLLFNAGRVSSYAVLGGILGLIGSKIQVSFQFTSLLIFAVSFLMIAMALQMLGLKAFRKFQFTLPRSFTRYISNEKNFQGKYMPFIMGGLTFFLPCGFTITAQGLALLSGNFIQGGLIMAAFAIGTMPALLSIGLSAIKFSSKPHLSYQFSKVAGILILFFALFNLNNQLNVMGFTSLNDIKNNFSQNNNNVNNIKTIDETGLAPIVDGKQVLKMNASASGYSPNYFKIKAGVPVRWEITDTGTSGCTNAVISKSLFSDAISLTPGQTSIKEFTADKPGKYKFSCWMGMISGIIEVVDSNNADSSNQNNSLTANSASDVIPSGSQGCGCGGGNSCGTK